MRASSRAIARRYLNDNDPAEPPPWNALLDLLADGENWACQSTPMIEMIEGVLVGLAVLADQHQVRRPFLDLLSRHSVRLLRGENPADYAVREIGRIEAP